MARGAAARRHAQAVFQLALERKELEQWRADLDLLSQVLSEPRLASLMGNPKVRLPDKMRLIREGLRGLNPLALNLAYLLVAKGRLALLPDLAKEYQRLMDAHLGIQHVQVVTAVPLEEGEKDHVTQRLGELTGKKVRLETSQDPALLGGLVIRIGDKLIDGSTRGRLAALRESLAQGIS